MFVRLFALVTCVVTIVACALVAWSEPGWSQLGLDMRMILVVEGGIAFFVLAVLVLKHETKVLAVATERRSYRRLQ